MPVSYPENPVSIGDHIRKKRMEQKLLQKDLAPIFNVTEDSIINWENNRSVPQIQFYPNIINFLGYLPFEVDLTTLPGKLKVYRHINGISQKELGKILKVNASTVSSWEMGEFVPNSAIFTKIEVMLKSYFLKLNNRKNSNLNNFSLPIVASNTRKNPNKMVEQKL